MSSREPRRVSSKTHTLDGTLFSSIDHAITHHATVLHEISGLLSTDLDKEALAICVSLIENGVNPEALAVCIIYERFCILKVLMSLLVSS